MAATGNLEPLKLFGEIEIIFKIHNSENFIGARKLAVTEVRCVLALHRFANRRILTPAKSISFAQIKSNFDFIIDLIESKCAISIR